MINAHRVVFNGFDSLDFDITPHLSFDGSTGAEPSFLNRESVHSEHYDGSFRRIHSYKYNEVLSPTFTFLKQNFSDFSESENRKILSWLTASDKPGWIDIYKDDSENVSYRLFGNFTETEVYKLGSSRVVGYIATFESSSPYAWSHKFMHPDTISEPTTFTIDCNSDEYNKVLFPKVTITFGSENIYIPIDKDPTVGAYEMMSNVIYSYQGSYYVKIDGNNYTLTGIFNTDITKQEASSTMLNKYYYFSGNKAIYKCVKSDGINKWELVGYVGAGVQIENLYKLGGKPQISKTTLTGSALNETVVLDGTNKVVSSTITPFRVIGDDFNWEWVPLAEGENNITVTGNCKIKFEWIEPRKVGSL